MGTGLAQQETSAESTHHVKLAAQSSHRNLLRSKKRDVFGMDRLQFI